MPDTDWFDDYMEYEMCCSSDNDGHMSDDGCFWGVMGVAIIAWTIICVIC